MELIPVVDLQKGLCVHAQRGLRHLYRPLTQFGDGKGTPHAVVTAYLALAPFKTLYLADLDALTGKRPQWTLVESLAENFPELSFWVDAAGIAPPASLQDRIKTIVGSESLPQGLEHRLANDGILSLDFRQDDLLGGTAILNHVDRWPARVIVMSLSKVGTLGGPDFNRLQAFRTQHPTTRLFAAGGVRHAHDIAALEAMGVSGVLLATALHQGALDRVLLQRFVGYTDPQA